MQNEVLEGKVINFPFILVKFKNGFETVLFILLSCFIISCYLIYFFLKKKHKCNISEKKDLLIIEHENIDNVMGDVDFTEWLFSANKNNNNENTSASNNNNNNNTKLFNFTYNNPS